MLGMFPSKRGSGPSETPAPLHFLGCRAVNPWNSLPSEVVQAPSLNSFKARLDKHWERYQYQTDVKGILYRTNSISRTDLSSYI